MFSMLRRVLGPKRVEVAGGWKRLHNEELHNLYASPDIVRVIKSRRMRWAVYVACVGEMRNACKTSVGKLVVDGSIILEWILGKQGEKVRTRCSSQDRDQKRVCVNTVMNLRVP
jgi:hypothetical protein